jgi:ABC-type nickel/cobalt efflux system permease component RcnA
VPDSERTIAIIVGLLAGHVALHWLADRTQALWKAAELAEDWLPVVSFGLLIVLFLGWALWRGLGSLRGASRPGEAPASMPR